ncbi:MAG TPA: hypothetical protein PLX89_10720 [Verrucomicrobiota bacterium]|nr:hypothetical protein [Verrucomicrobiales bacterium]HRI13469.1 hypothetical protein [Verrucomicrobiota bacterium]
MRSITKLLLLGMLWLGTRPAVGFSLQGPLETWQDGVLNYVSIFTSIKREGDTYGPMNLGNEYRWGSPVLVYGFDSSFVEYFGPQGVAAVEAAVKILNDLPGTTEMTPELQEFPLTATRYNYVAQQLRLRDVKSLALSILLEQMGLACPERYTWTLRSRTPIPNTQPQQYYFNTIKRNFDPVTWRPSSYVNNTLYTYQIVRLGDDYFDCQELAVDVANPNVTVMATSGLQAGVTDPRVKQQVYGPLSWVAEGFGLFYTGLTRDDVGGLRYLYRGGNTNWQAAPLGSGGSAFSTPWGYSGFQILNPNIGSPWTVVGGPLVGATNGGGVVISSTFVDNGGRGGPQKVNFVRVDTDPLLGLYLSPVVIRYGETVIDQFGQALRQIVERPITQPDILFTAADVGVDPGVGQSYVYGILNTQATYVSSVPPSFVGVLPPGPGIVEPGIQVIFNKVGPWIFNITETTEELGVRGFVWGSYDGTTNAPVVYPVGSTLQEIESTLFRGY